MLLNDKFNKLFTLPKCTEIRISPISIFYMSECAFSKYPMHILQLFLQILLKFYDFIISLTDFRITRDKALKDVALMLILNGLHLKRPTLKR